MRLFTDEEMETLKIKIQRKGFNTKYIRTIQAIMSEDALELMNRTEYEEVFPILRNLLK